MTVIIGYVDRKNKKTYVGSDSCISSYMRKNTISLDEGKIFIPEENPNFIFGFAGDIRIKQLISAFMNFPKEEIIEANHSIVDTNFIVRNIIPAIQGILEENKYEDKNLMRSQILIAYKDNLWSIGVGMQLVSFDSDFLCIGSGSEHAYTALEIFNQKEEMYILEKMVKALNISSKLSIGVEGPNFIYGTGNTFPLDPSIINVLGKKSKEVRLQTIKNNYVKKIIAKDIDIMNEEEMNKYFNSDFLCFNECDSNDIYFFSRRGVLNILKDNGDVILNSNYFADMAMNPRKYNIIELNAKGKNILDNLKKVLDM